MTPHRNYAVRTLRERLKYLTLRRQTGRPDTAQRIAEVKAAIKILIENDKLSPTQPPRKDQPMDYERAKALVAQHAPELLIDEDNGHLHVNVRRTETGNPHSITLPTSTAAMPQTEQQMEDIFVASLEAAKSLV